MSDLDAAMRRMYGAMASGDLDELEEILAPGFVDHDPEEGQGPGVQGVKDSFAMFREAFPDLSFEVNDVFSTGNKAVGRVRFSGTNTGNLGPMPATGKTVSVETIDIIRFENGLAVERWGQYDRLSFMQQLGLIPEMT